ncbi:MAG: hypothetical protein D6751_10300, partial [Deltaproteobacteria bacterium]
MDSMNNRYLTYRRPEPKDLALTVHEGWQTGGIAQHAAPLRARTIRLAHKHTSKCRASHIRRRWRQDQSISW